MKILLGDSLPEREFLLTRDSLVRYAGASGDFNPIHYRDDIAISVGLPGVLAHGMLTMGVAIQLICDYLGDSGRVLDYQVRFTKPVPVDPISGALLKVTAEVVEIDEALGRARIDLKTVFDQNVVLGKAQCWVRL